MSLEIKPQEMHCFASENHADLHLFQLRLLRRRMIHDA